LAAQSKVRYSIDNPSKFIQSNLVGFANIQETTRNFYIKNLIYSSNSYVYGVNSKLLFFVNQFFNHPVSLYAASKKSNQLIVHCYRNLFGIPATALRLFTVYVP